MIDGHYIRITDGNGTHQSAEIKISRIASRASLYHVSGFALWGKEGELGPNSGDFDLVMEFSNDRLEHASESGDHPYRLDIKVQADGLVVGEQNSRGVYGMNVDFTGAYAKAG